jgi:ubiquinone/menaquinone biosynthesis C-methylase UbiE
MQRITTPELLDTDAGTPSEVASSLADLRWFNRYFGGLSTTYNLLHRVVRALRFPASLSYLDVAGASADGASFAAERLHRVRTELHITVLDRSPVHLSSGRPGTAALVCGDALALPFADRSVDVVGSSLFLHHLDPQELSAFIREALRVARSAVIVNDLSRSRLHYAFAVAGRPLYRSRLTRHDAPVSVQRAYTPAEMHVLLQQIPCARIEITRHYFFRLGVILWK